MIKDGQKCIICHIVAKNGTIKHTSTCAEYQKVKK